MAGQRQSEKSSPQQMEDYLRGLKSSGPGDSAESTDNDESLEDFLLERAAGDLRAARTRLEELRQSLDGE